MARRRKVKDGHDNETREDYQKRIDRERAEDEEESEEESDEDDLEVLETTTPSTKATTTKSRKKSSASSVTPSLSTGKKGKRSTAVSSHSSDSEEENTNPYSQSGSDSRQSSPKPRQSAGTSQQISDLKAKNRDLKMAKSKEQARLERENAEIREQLEQVRQEREQAVARAQAEATKKKALQVKYRATLAKVGGTRSQDQLKNQAMVQQVKRSAKKKLWAIVKFIVNDVQLAQATLILADLMQLKELQHSEGETDAERELIDEKRGEFQVIYSTDCRHAINEQRSYYQGEAKKLYTAYRIAGGSAISYEKFKEIAMRNVYYEDGNPDPAKVKIFDLYVLMLSACAGSSTYGEKQRRTLPISTARKDADGKLCVPYGTEAMTLVMFDNCVEKWDRMYNFKHLDKNPAKIPKYSPKKHEETLAWKTKYSDACSGNSPYGGWGEDGIKAFNELTKEIKTLRETRSEEILEVENAAVQRFQELYVEDRKRKAEASGGTYEEDDGSGDSRASKKSKSRSSDQVVAMFDMGE